MFYTSRWTKFQHRYEFGQRNLELASEETGILTMDMRDPNQDIFRQLSSWNLRVQFLLRHVDIINEGSHPDIKTQNGQNGKQLTDRTELWMLLSNKQRGKSQWLYLYLIELDCAKPILGFSRTRFKWLEEFFKSFPWIKLITHTPTQTQKIVRFPPYTGYPFSGLMWFMLPQ